MVSIRQHDCERQERNSKDHLNQLYGCWEMDANSFLVFQSHQEVSLTI